MTLTFCSLSRLHDFDHAAMTDQASWGESPFVSCITLLLLLLLSPPKI